MLRCLNIHVHTYKVFICRFKSNLIVVYILCFFFFYEKKYLEEWDVFISFCSF